MGVLLVPSYDRTSGSLQEGLRELLSRAGESLRERLRVKTHISTDAKIRI